MFANIFCVINTGPLLLDFVLNCGLWKNDHCSDKIYLEWLALCSGYTSKWGKTFSIILLPPIEKETTWLSMTIEKATSFTIFFLDLLTIWPKAKTELVRRKLRLSVPRRANPRRKRLPVLCRSLNRVNTNVIDALHDICVHLVDKR